MPKYQPLFDLVPAPKRTAFGQFFKTFTGYRDKVMWAQIENALKRQDYDQKELQRLYRDLVKQKNDLIREQSLLVVTGQRSEDSRTRSLRSSAEGASSATLRHEQRMYELRQDRQNLIMQQEQDSYQKALGDHQKIFNNNDIQRRINVVINQGGEAPNFNRNYAVAIARRFKSNIAGGVSLNTPEGAAAIDLMYRELSNGPGGQAFADQFFLALKEVERNELGGVGSIDDLRYEHYLDSDRGPGETKRDRATENRIKGLLGGSPGSLFGSDPSGSRNGITRIFRQGSDDPLKKQYDTLQERINDLDQEIKKIEDKREALGSTGGLIDLGGGAVAQNWITDNPFTTSPAWVEALANSVAGAVETPTGRRQVNEMFDLLAEHKNPSEALEWSINNQWPPPLGLTEDLTPDRDPSIIEESAIAEEADQPTPLVAFGDTESAEDVRNFLSKFESDISAGRGLPFNELSQKIMQLEERGDDVSMGIANSLKRSLRTLDDSGDMNRFLEDIRGIRASQAEPLVEEAQISRERQEIAQQAEQAEIPSFIRSKLGAEPGVGMNLQDTVSGLDFLVDSYNTLQADPTTKTPGREGDIARLGLLRAQLEEMGRLRDPLLSYKAMSFNERKDFADNLRFLTESRHQNTRQRIDMLKDTIQTSSDLPPDMIGSLQQDLNNSLIEEDALINELTAANEAVGILGGIAESYQAVGARPLPVEGEVSDIFEETKDLAQQDLAPPVTSFDLDQDTVNAYVGALSQGTTPAVPAGYLATAPSILLDEIGRLFNQTQSLEEQMKSQGSSPELASQFDELTRRMNNAETAYNDSLQQRMSQLGIQDGTDGRLFLEKEQEKFQPEVLRQEPLIEPLPPAPMSDDEVLMNGI